MAVSAFRPPWRLRDYISIRNKNAYISRSEIVVNGRKGCGRRERKSETEEEKRIDIGEGEKEKVQRREWEKEVGWETAGASDIKRNGMGIYKLCLRPAEGKRRRRIQDRAGEGWRKPVWTGGDEQLSLGQNLWYVRPSCPGIPARGPCACCSVYGAHLCVGKRLCRSPKTSVMWQNKHYLYVRYNNIPVYIGGYITVKF